MKGGHAEHMGLSLLDRDTTAGGPVAIEGFGTFDRRRSMARQKSLKGRKNALRGLVGTSVIDQVCWKPGLKGRSPAVLENQSVLGEEDDLVIIECKPGADPGMVCLTDSHLSPGSSGFILTAQYEYVVAGSSAGPLDPDCQAVERHFDATSDLPAQLVRYIEALSAPEWTLGFDLRNRQDVVRFVERQARVKALLAEARERIPEYFGDDAPLVLEMRTDPEWSCPPELFLYVVTTLEPEEVSRRLEALEDGWWLEAVGNAPVNLHVEFA